MIKSKIDIIKETAAFYSDPSNRARSWSGCQYLDTESGNSCAIGRCCKNPEEIPTGPINEYTIWN